MARKISFSIVVICTLLFLSTAISEFDSVAQLHDAYSSAELLMAQGKYAEAAVKFDSLSLYSDSSKMAMYCRAVEMAENQGQYGKAISAFQDLGEFRDSRLMATYYQGRQYQAYADWYLESDKRSTLVRANNYFKNAAETYETIVLFKDCLERLEACRSCAAEERINAYDYKAAEELEEAGKYEEALKAFEALGSYSDSWERARKIQEVINANKYKAAEELEEAGKYEEALKAFKALGSYSDSWERGEKLRYLLNGNAPINEPFTISADVGDTEITFNPDGTYRFWFAAYSIEDSGFYTYEDGVLTLTDKNGMQSIGEGDPIKLHYTYSGSDQLAGDYTIPVNIFNVGGKHTATKLVTVPSEDKGTSMTFFDAGTYRFWFAAYSVEDLGTYTYEDGILTLTDKNGKQSIGEGDPIRLHYTYSDSDMLTGDYIILVSTFRK